LALFAVDLLLDESRIWAHANWHHVGTLVRAEIEVGPK
jgi:hypothetical protein